MTVKEDRIQANKKLQIEVFCNKDDDGMVYTIDNIVKRLYGTGISNDEFTIDWRKLNETEVYGGKRLPYIVYRMGNERELLFEGQTSSVSLFWKAFTILRPLIPYVRTRGRGSKRKEIEQCLLQERENHKKHTFLDVFL